LDMDPIWMGLGLLMKAPRKAKISRRSRAKVFVAFEGRYRVFADLKRRCGV
jgi:hypothetical protein